MKSLLEVEYNNILGGNKLSSSRLDGGELSMTAIRASDPIRRPHLSFRGGVRLDGLATEGVTSMPAFRSAHAESPAEGDLDGIQRRDCVKTISPSASSVDASDRSLAKLTYVVRRFVLGAPQAVRHEIMARRFSGRQA